MPNASELASVDSVRFDIAFKGPVYYGDELLMKSAAVDRGYRFDVYSGSGKKPVMPGRIVTVAGLKPKAAMGPWSYAPSAPGCRSSRGVQAGQAAEPTSSPPR